MQDWNQVLANRLKRGNEKLHQKAVEEATGFIGNLESIKPLKISIMDGLVQYDAEDIFVTRNFEKIPAEEKVAGTKILVMPLDGLDSVVVVDIII